MPKKIRPKKSRPRWIEALASLSSKVGAEVVQDFHAATINGITELPAGPIKDHAICGVLTSEVVRRDKLGEEVARTLTIDDEVRRYLGSGRRKRAPDTVAAGQLAIRARIQFAMSPWHDGCDWLKEQSDGSKVESKAFRDYVDARRSATVNACGEMEERANRRSYGRTYGNPHEAQPSRVHGDQPYQGGGA